MQKFYIFNANGQSNPQPEKLISDILKTINREAVFINRIDTIGHLDSGEPLLQPIDMIYFDGGEDVSPKGYGAFPHPKTFVNRDRDDKETSYFRSIKKSYPNIPCFGICRGSQKLTVLSGGRLIQHVEGHGVSHTIDVPHYDKKVKVTSTHHQMMYPFNLPYEDYKILGYSSVNLSPIHETANDHGAVVNIRYPKNFVECEIVYYPKTNSLCIQGHPEYASATAQFVELTKELLLRLLYNKL